MAQVQVKKLDSRAVLPTSGSALAAGYDLYSCLDADVTILPGETAKIGTGLALALPEGTFGAVFARSGLATREGLRPANCVGVCDSDYRGEILVALHNQSGEAQTVEDGERIAQLVITPYLTAAFSETDTLTDTVRGSGGFGSTGKK